MKVFVFDLAKCNGCYNCQIACKDEHCDQPWLPISEAQPLTGQFWLKIHEREHGQIPKIKVEYVPKMCNHCENAACMATAGDAVYRRDDGLVIIDPVKAKGHKELVDACPYGHIYWNEELELPQKCTGCAHILDDSDYKVPHCVDVCPTEALRYVEESEVAEELKNAEVLTSAGAGAKVYYLGLQKFFIGGEVWDPEIDEIIEGAAITLKKGDEVVATTESDSYGDFWFYRLEAGNYTVEIAADGYVSQTVEIALMDSVNLGDFPLARA